MASDSDSIRLGMPMWIPISQWRPTVLPISADSSSPESAANSHRSDSFRSPIRPIDSIMGAPALGRAASTKAASAPWPSGSYRGADANATKAVLLRNLQADVADTAKWRR
eukprot:3927887-Pyramimonas_sp.AAC.1